MTALAAALMLTQATHFDDCMFVAKLMSRKPFDELLELGWPRHPSSLGLPWLPAKLYQTHLADDNEAPKQNMNRFATQFRRIFYDDEGYQAFLR